MTTLPEAWNELDLARHEAEFYRMRHAGHEAGLSPVAVFSTMREPSRSCTDRNLHDALFRGTEDRATVAEMIRAYASPLMRLDCWRRVRSRKGWEGFLTMLGKPADMYDEGSVGAGNGDVLVV